MRISSNLDIIRSRLLVLACVSLLILGCGTSAEVSVPGRGTIRDGTSAVEVTEKWGEPDRILHGTDMHNLAELTARNIWTDREGSRQDVEYHYEFAGEIYHVYLDEENGRVTTILSE